VNPSQINGYHITDLPTNISLIQDNSDAASFGVLSRPNELLNKGLNLKVDKSGDAVIGDLLMSSSNNDRPLLYF